MQILNDSEIAAVAGAGTPCDPIVLQVGIPAGVSIQGSLKDIATCLDYLWTSPDNSGDYVLVGEPNAHDPNYSPASNAAFEMIFSENGGGGGSGGSSGHGLQMEEYNDVC